MMRSYKKFRYYTKLIILNLEYFNVKYPLIAFKYSKKVNSEIMKTLFQGKYPEIDLWYFEAKNF